MRQLVFFVLLLFVLTACASAPIATSAFTSTPDVCAGAAAAGARQNFSFEQIIPCLNTVPKVSEFMKNNIQYDVEYDIRERGRNEYVPASVVYERGIDDADGYAILQCYLLERNGFDAYMIGLSIDTPVGSNVCGVNNADGTVLVLEGEGQTAGPFNSFTDLAAYYTDKGWMQSGGSLITLRASQVTQVTTDFTSPSVLELPWISQQY